MSLLVSLYGPALRADSQHAVFNSREKLNGVIVVNQIRRVARSQEPNPTATRIRCCTTRSGRIDDVNVCQSRTLRGEVRVVDEGFDGERDSRLHKGVCRVKGRSRCDWLDGCFAGSAVLLF